MEKQPRRQVKCAIFGNPGVSSPSELIKIISEENIRGIILKKDNASMIISGKTIKGIISHKNPAIREDLTKKLLKAIQDASDLKVDYEIDNTPFDPAKQEVFSRREQSRLLLDVSLS